MYHIKVREEIRQFPELNNTSTSHQSIWDTMKVVLRGKFIAVLTKTEHAQTNNPMM